MKNRYPLGIGVYEPGPYPATLPTGRFTQNYMRWVGMIERCYPLDRNKFPAYEGCKVAPEWLKFQEFAEWCHNQIGFDQPKWHIDKDILIPGNKIYGPDTCVFVPPSLNNLIKPSLIDAKGWSMRGRRYHVTVKSGDKTIHLGNYDTQEAASTAYKAAKINEIHRQAAIYKDVIDQRAYAALMAYGFK